MAKATKKRKAGKKASTKDLSAGRKARSVKGGVHPAAVAGGGVPGKIGGGGGAPGTTVPGKMGITGP